MESECSLKVRSYECDVYGHVNNANYLHYLEYARCEFLRDAGFDYPRAIASGYGLFVVRIEIDYVKPALPDEILSIRTAPLKKGAASGIMRQEILRDNETLVRAKVTWAFVDAKTGTPTRIPPEWDLPGLGPVQAEKGE